MPDNNNPVSGYERPHMERIALIESRIDELEKYVVEDKVDSAVAKEHYREIHKWMTEHTEDAKWTKRAIFGSAIAIVINVLYQIMTSGVVSVN